MALFFVYTFEFTTLSTQKHRYPFSFGWILTICTPFLTKIVSQIPFSIQDQNSTTEAWFSLFCNASGIFSVANITAVASVQEMLLPIIFQSPLLVLSNLMWPCYCSRWRSWGPSFFHGLCCCSFAAEAFVLTAVDVPRVPAMTGASAVFAFPSTVDISSATGVSLRCWHPCCG